MTLIERVVIAIIKGLARILCNVDETPLAHVPQHGPLILVANHINFLEVPLLYAYLRPRPIFGFAKVETWDNPVLGWLFNVGRAIPLRRGEADVNALRHALALLKEGCIIAIAPEGTRSGDGRLLRARSGAVMLALRSGAPLLPVAHYGGEIFWRNIFRLRRTDFHIVVGSPFYLKAEGVNAAHNVRRQMIDEVMYQIAALLPPPYRGHYAQVGAATEKYLCFPEASQSNLQCVPNISQG